MSPLVLFTDAVSAHIDRNKADLDPIARAQLRSLSLEWTAHKIPDRRCAAANYGGGDGGDSARPRCTADTDGGNGDGGTA